MTGLIEFLAKALVSRPELVELHSQVTDGATVFDLKVAPEDIGKVIGRDGRTVNAIRTLVAAAAAKRGEKVRLEIRDDRRAVAAATPGGAPRPDES